MGQFVVTLPLCHVLLPLAAAGLFLVIRCRGAGPARAVVIASAAGSLTLGMLLIGVYLSADSQHPTGNDASRAVRDLHESDTEGAVAPLGGGAPGAAINGVSVWFLTSIPLVVLCVLLSEPAERWQPLPIAALLAGESAALAVFTVGNIVTLSAAFGALGLANAVVVGSRGAAGIRAVARTLLFQQYGATILIMIGLGGAVVACSHMRGASHAAPQMSEFNLDGLVHEVRRLTNEEDSHPQIIWRQLSPWLFLSFVAGCLVWSGAFPFHVAPSAALRDGGPAGRALLGGITLKVGAWGLLRIAMPLFPGLMKSLGPFLLLWVILSALYCAVSMYGAWIDAGRGATLCLPARAMNLRRFAAEGAVIFVLLSMSGVLSQTVSGIVGAALLLSAHMVCWMLYVLLSGGAADSGLPGRSGDDPGRGGHIFVMLAFAGIPGLALFPGLLLMLLGLSGLTATLAVGPDTPYWLEILLAWPMLLLYWLVIAVSGWTYLDQAGAPAVASGRHWRPGVRTAAVLLAGTILLIGVAPGIITNPMTDGLFEILQQPKSPDASASR